MTENVRLRILHLILVLGETNGQYNEHCLPMMHERDLSICTFFPPKLTPPNEIRLFPGDGSLGGFFRALRRALDAAQHDVIHVHAPQSGGLVVVALLAWGRYRRLRRSLVYTVQDSFYDYPLHNKVLTLFSLVTYGRVIFCSQAALDSIPALFRRIVRRRARVVPNAADIERVDRALAGHSSSRGTVPFKLISVGRLEAVKDPATVVSAFEAAGSDRARMTLIGAGALESSLARQVEELDLAQRIELTGLIPRDAVFRQCADADLFISASHGEGLPVAVIEALAAECPAILSDIPPHREVLDGADFIPLVPVGDVDGFAREIRRFQAMPHEERARIGRKGREHVVARFTLPIMHAAVEEVYRESGTSSGQVSRPARTSR
ncbi:MAG: glycosyltransferase family 4 protein [Actinomycetota bacterium]